MEAPSRALTKPIAMAGAWPALAAPTSAMRRDRRCQHNSEAASAASTCSSCTRSSSSSSGGSSGSGSSWLLRPLLLSLAFLRSSAQFVAPPPPPPVLIISPPKLPEEALRARYIKDVNLTLTGTDLLGRPERREWVPELGIDLDATAEWLAREVVGSADQTRGWLATVAPYLSPAHVVRVSGEKLTLNLFGIDGSGWYPAFDVQYAEAVSIGAPYWVTADNITAEPAYANLTLDMSVPAVDVLGELVGGSVAVGELRARSHSLQLVLSGGEWALDAGRPGHAAYDALSRALVGPQDVGLAAGSSGWQRAASGLLRASRDNATHLTLTIPPLPAYRIDAPETVHVTVPSAALLNHHLALEYGLGSFVVRATAGSATLAGDLLHSNSSTRRDPPSVAGRSLEVRLLADTWAAALASDDALRRVVVMGMRSAQAEVSGWNAILDFELARNGDVTRADPANSSLSIQVPIGLGNLTLQVLDATTLRLTLPTFGPAIAYAIREPEAIEVTIPAAALTSASEAVVATPAVRLEAAGGSATVAGTLIADTLPPTFINVTRRRTVTLRLAAEGAYGWWTGLREAETAAARVLLDDVEARLLRINDSSYDDFDFVCLANSSNVTNATSLDLNGTNATLAHLSSLLNASFVTDETANRSSSGAADGFVNASASASAALLELLLNASNATNASVPAPTADFCASLVNSSVVNGSLVVHSIAYSPYCDPCLVPRRVTPRPVNYTSISLHDPVENVAAVCNMSALPANDDGAPAIGDPSLYQLREHGTCNVTTSYLTMVISLPEVAELTAHAANITVPRGALSRHFAAAALVAASPFGGGGSIALGSSLGSDPGSSSSSSSAGGGADDDDDDDDEASLAMVQYEDPTSAAFALAGLVDVYETTEPVPSGVFFSHNDEASLRSSQDYTIELHLTDDAWVPNITAPLGDSSTPGYDLLLGIASAQSEPSGWNRIVIPHLLRTPDILHRVSDTHLVLRLDAIEEYDILAVETLHITVPASAVVSRRVIEALPVVPIYPVGGSAVLDGTCVSVREEVVRSLQVCTVDVTLANDAWVDGLDAIEAGEAFVQGLRAVVPQPGGWDAASAGVLSARSITVLDATRLSVEIPQMAGFDILSAQQIQLSIPPVAVSSNHGYDSNNTIRILPSAGQAALSGSLLRSLSEDALRGGSLAPGAQMELTISLTGDSFVPFAEQGAAAANATGAEALAGGGAGWLASNATNGTNGTLAAQAAVDVERAALLAGIRSAQDEPRGWNAIVGPSLAAADVLRLSDTVVRLTVRAAAAYSIDEPETVAVTLPAQLLSSQEEIVASPSLRIAALKGRATLGGPLLAVASEALVLNATRSRTAAAEATLEISVGGGDGWASGVGVPGSAPTAALLAGLTAEQSEPSGWNAIVRPSLGSANVSAPVNGTVRLSLPQLCDACLYSIASPETIRLVVPAAALLSGSPVLAAGALVINASAGAVVLGGSLAAGAADRDIADVHPRVLELRLLDDAWEPRMGHAAFAPTAELLGGLRPLVEQPRGWGAVVASGLGARSVRRVDEYTLAIDVPQFAAYKLRAPETVTLEVPGAAVLSRTPPRLVAPLVIAATPGSARLGGSLQARPEEGILQAHHGANLTIALTADAFVDDLHAPHVFGALLAGIVSSGAEPGGWMAQLMPRLAQRHLHRLDETTAAFFLPQVRESARPGPPRRPSPLRPRPTPSPHALAPRPPSPHAHLAPRPPSPCALAPLAGGVVRSRAARAHLRDAARDGACQPRRRGGALAHRTARDDGRAQRHARARCRRDRGSFGRGQPAHAAAALRRLGGRPARHAV